MRRDRVESGLYNRFDEADLFYEDLTGEIDRWTDSLPEIWEEPEQDWHESRAVGQARIAGTQYVIEPSATAIHRAATLDDAMLPAVSRPRGHTVILGSALGGTAFVVHTWGPSTSLRTPLTIEVDASRVAAVIINGGTRVYIQSNPAATAASDRLRWIHIPSVREFLRLPDAQRTAQRNIWIRRLVRSRVVNPATRSAFTAAALATVSSSVLRALLSHHSTQTFPVRSVNRRGMDRGGVVHGVSLPQLHYPITEPAVYLRVISMVEGRMESINAWDARAGISLGPIQVNVQRAALFQFLWRVWQADRHLFTSTLGADWAMRNTSGYPELSVPVAGRAVWLRGRSAAADVRRNYAYFQSGNPEQPALSQINAAHRRDLARRFADLVARPHIQELLAATSARWLQPGLERIHRAGIPALDTARPDRDLFILKSLLLSTYVRFSGCLAPLLTALERWPTPSAKLANWRTALASMGGACSATGDARQVERNRNLRERLGNQQRQGAAVFTAIQRMITPVLAARSELHSVATTPTVSLAPRNAAELFDRLSSGDTEAENESGLSVLAMPGQKVPENLPSHSYMLVRALGEGRFAALRDLQPVAPDEWIMEGIRAPVTLRSGDSIGHDRLLLAQQAPELVTRCGFFGPNVQRTEQQVRNTVRDLARREWTNWHTSAGVPRSERLAAMFGNLVRYYTSAIGRVQPDTLSAILVTAAGPINYGNIPGSGAASSSVNNWAVRVRRQLLTGAPNTNVPPDLARRVTNAVKHARHAHLNAGAFRAWSSVWVTAVVRGAAMQLGLEAMIQGNHSGRNELLLATGRHAEYTLEAHRRRAGPNKKRGTYHAFSPTDRAPRVGDIIVQDRHANAPQRPLTFAQINVLARGRMLHGDIVVSVSDNHVETLGGNLGGSCKKRHFPVNNNRLVIERNQLYVNERNTGTMPNLPSTSTHALHSRSTLRIFAILSPVEVCAAVPGQPYGGGILT